MSSWTHAVCATHWNEREGVSAIDSHMTRPIDPCCWCGTRTNIYVRDDPATVPCKGEHPWEDE
jgi:hypothetical protein